MSSSARRIGLRWALAVVGLLIVSIAVLFVMPYFATRVEGAPAVQSADCAQPKDIDGHSYPSVKIAGLCWLGSNLKTLRYRDGTTIKGASVVDKTRHGVLYRYAHVVHPAGLCPLGWRVASDDDFKNLERWVGLDQSQLDQMGWRGDGAISRLLKSYDTAFFWSDRERRRVNASGFSFTASGAEFGGRVSGLGRFGDLWTQTEYDADTAIYRSVFWISVTSPFRAEVDKIRRAAVSKEWGFSVRCVSDPN